MPDLPPHRAERAALCDVSLRLGPDAPTLCEGWTTYDMAAHLVVREHKPIASIGLVVPAVAGWHDDAILRMKQRHPFEDLVERVRTGPPVHWKLVDAPFNTQEYFIHHEDVRRGDGDTGPRPAEEVTEIEEALWAGLRKGHRLATRKIKGVRVDLVTPAGDTIHSGKGDDVVTITGRPGEIILYLSGRTAAADVTVAGSDRARAALGDADLGI